MATHTRLRLQVATDKVRDAVVLRCGSSESVEEVLQRVLAEYASWHPFPVYEFDLFVQGKWVPRDAKVADVERGMLQACESAVSVERRRRELREKRERQRLMEEKRIQQEALRRARMDEFLDRGDCWTLEGNPANFEVPLNEDGLVAINKGTHDQWCVIRRVRPIRARGKYFFSVRIRQDADTSNSWRFSVGVVPLNFKVNGDKRWVGSQKSWGYVAGNGGKCFNSGKHHSYGAKYGGGDVIGVLLDYDTSTIEFYKNGLSQGVAFKNLTCPVFPAVSMTGANAQVEMCTQVYPAALKNVFLTNAADEEQRRQRWSEMRSIDSIEKRKRQDMNSWDASFSAARDKMLYYPSQDLTHVMNEGSGDKWRTTRSLHTFSSGVQFFEVVFVADQSTTNTWRAVVGVVPTDFTCTTARIWVGAQRSWGYIAGTGGKVNNTGQSSPYASPYQGGDRIGVLLNFDDKTIEYFLNGESQGVAFRNLEGPVHAAVSLTGEGSCVALVTMKPCAAERYIARAKANARITKQILQTYGNAWDPRKSSTELLIAHDGQDVSNTGSNDKWRTVASLLPYSHGRRYFEITVNNFPDTTNSWKVIVGAVPRSFNFAANPKNRVWVGAQESWGYIAGNGDKCFNSGKSESYGRRYNANMRIGVLLDFDNNSIEFYRNGVSQGVAFENLSQPVFAAVSLCATSSSVTLHAQAENDTGNIDRLFLYK